MNTLQSLCFCAVLFLSVGTVAAFTGGTGSGGSASGGGTGSTGGSGATGGAVGIGSGVTDSGGEAQTEGEGGAGAANDGTIDDSGIIAPDAAPGADNGFSAGDAAPRQEAPIREDRFNTTPRVPAEPAFGTDGTGGADAGGAGGTGVDPIEGTGTTVDDTIGDRDATRQLNGTAGSRPEGSTIR